MQLPLAHCEFLFTHPPLFSGLSKGGLYPLLLHSESLVQRQRVCVESHTGRGDGRLVTHAYVVVDVTGCVQAPEIQTVPLAQLEQAPPFAPQAELARPATHVPDEQQPPLQVCVDEHEVVHVPVDVLHAYPDGQSDAFAQTAVHVPFLHVLPLGQTNADPHPPQSLLSVMKLVHVPLQRL